MKVIRKCRCLSCGQRFSRTMDDAQPLPDCPSCGTPEPPDQDRVSSPAIIGSKSKAMDQAYKIAEQDFGMTNMRDNLREGDSAYIQPSPQQVNPGNITKPAMIWGGASPSMASPLPSRAEMLAGAKQASMMAKAEHRNPMEMLHKARPKLVATPLNKGG